MDDAILHAKSFGKSSHIHLQHLCFVDRKVAKRPTAVLFTNKEDCVVISDKAGDVYRLEYELDITHIIHLTQLKSPTISTSAPGYQFRGFPIEGGNWQIPLSMA